ncbi:MAG: hypothetical protein U1E56_02250 [Bauldia sp.]
MTQEGWYPAVESNQVVGRFEWYDKLHIADSIAADEKRYTKIIVLRHKVVGTHEENVTPLKPHNEQALRERFPEAWTAFQGEVPPIKGTPLTKLDLSSDRVDAFKIHGILTLEQLAGLSDAQCQAVGFGTRKLRTDAAERLAELRTVAVQAPASPSAAPVVPPPSARRRGRTKANGAEARQ